MFNETGLLVPGADVRIAGVNVGRVTAVVNKGVNSFVTVDISQQYAPIPRDTRAILRQKTLLGEAYVALSSGTGSGPKLADGGTIPQSQVAPTQQLDKVLNAFGKPTQLDLQEFLSGSATALAGRGEDLNSGFGNLDPALADLDTIVGVLDGEQGSVHQLLSSGATVFTTLGQRSADLQSLITAGDQVLSATASRNASTDGDRQRPTRVPEVRLRMTLDHARSTLSLAKPSLDALLPAAPLLAPTLQGLITLSGPALRLLHAAPRLVSDSLVALPAITRFERAFRPGLDALEPAVQQVSPIISFIGLYRRELVTAMSNLAASLEARAPSNAPGGTTNYLRSLAVVGNDSIFGQTVREPTNRSNAYFSPGELANLNNGGLRAASCANTGNKSQSRGVFPNVPCKVQPGFRWGGLTRYFPHVTAGSS